MSDLKKVKKKAPGKSFASKGDYASLPDKEPQSIEKAYKPVMKIKAGGKEYKFKRLPVKPLTKEERLKKIAAEPDLPKAKTVKPKQTNRKDAPLKQPKPGESRKYIDAKGDERRIYSTKAKGKGKKTLV